MSSAAIRKLEPRFLELWDDQVAAVQKRAERHKIDSLLDEFRGQLRVSGENLVYEHAFLPTWHESAGPLYDLRWWINEQMAGVYFLFDEDDRLRYVGTSCGGTMGDRMHLKKHRPYVRAVDVILFDCRSPHCALAVEAFAISRLKPPENSATGFKTLTIPAAP